MKNLFQKLTSIALMSLMFAGTAGAYNQQSSEDNISLAQAAGSGAGYDTLAYTVEEYVEYSHSISSETARTSISPEDLEESAERTCAAFLSLGAAASRSDAYSISPLTETGAEVSKEIVYFESVCDYLNQMRDALGWKVYQDNMQFSDFQTVLSGDTADVSVVEEYTYYMDTGDETEDSDPYFRRRQYFFTLEKDMDGWNVVKVTSNHYEEQMDGFDYTPIPVEQQVREVLNREDLEDASEIPDEKIEVMPAADTDLYKWTYDTTAAVDYAKKYYDTFNSLFGDAGADCQNFASQCVWAGLGGSNSKTAYPAVSTKAVGSDAPNVWCRGQQTTCYTNDRWVASWDFVPAFAKMIKVSNSIEIGPFGNTHYGNLKYAAKGSVISQTKQATADDTNTSHAMFVTKVTGTTGKRVKSDIYIAAHNSPTSSAFQPLSEYSYSASNEQFATCVISCGYYPTEQP